jgi:hypothetical protein
MFIFAPNCFDSHVSKILDSFATYNSYFCCWEQRSQPQLGPSDSSLDLVTLLAATVIRVITVISLLGSTALRIC